jgi:hypothetical protein
MTDYEKTYEEFWKPIVETPEGEPIFDQIQRELHDFSTLMHNVSLVYEHVTGGQVSKPLTDPEVVKTMADDHYREICDLEIGEMMEGLRNP